MGIKASKGKIQREHLEYPCLVEERKRKDGLVLLMTSSTTGTLVYAGQDTIYEVGYHSTAWDILKFKEYLNPITLITT